MNFLFRRQVGASGVLLGLLLGSVCARGVDVPTDLDSAVKEIQSQVQSAQEKVKQSGILDSLTNTANSAAVVVGQEDAISWNITMPAILARIKAPVFAANDFPITNYGAVSDGKQDCTDAIRQAIAACNAAGGGRVIVPAGTFLTGAVNLLSNVNLHLNDGATLKFIADPSKYLPMVHTRWEGIECMNYSPFIYAYAQQNIAITGNGTLDGSAAKDNWWLWLEKGKPAVVRLNAQGQQGLPLEQRTFGKDSFLRPNFIQPYHCENVLVEGVTITNSPMWEINPEFCTNVIVRGVTVNCPDGPNNDGCDPESCHDVLIENCTFTTGDDCICIKSGRNEDGRRLAVSSENIIIRNCTMKDGHGGVVIGSEVSGNCRDVFVENCKMDSPNLERALRLKDNATRGGVIENIFLRNVTIGKVAEAVLTVDFLYEEGAQGPYKPVARNIVLQNVTSNGSPRVMYVVGFPGAQIDRIIFKNCSFKNVTDSDIIDNAGNITFQNVIIDSKNRPPSLSTRPQPPSS